MKSLLPIALLVLLCQSCSKAPDLNAEEKAILALHNEQRKAHVDKNPALLLSNNAIDYMEVNRGSIKKPSSDESLQRFTAYFEAVDFVKWDDVNPPIITFSDDATMATTIVDKLVITQNKENNQLDTVQYAWLAVYKKNNGKWELQQMCSTKK